MTYLPIYVPGASWEEIQQCGEVLEEKGLVVNEEVFHDLTLEDGEEMKIPKQNYANWVDQPSFTGKANCQNNMVVV